MNIFLVEDSVSIRRLLVRRLDAMPGMRVVGEAAGQKQALALIRWTQPDIVLMDLSLANGSGLGLLADLRQGGYTGRVVVLTSQDLDAYRRACMDAGADAFYDKASGLETLFDDLAVMQPAYAQDVHDSPAALLRDGLTGLYGEAALCEQLGRAAHTAFNDGVDLAVYVLRVPSLIQVPGDVVDTLAGEVALRLHQAGEGADTVVRSAVNPCAFVLTRVDQAGAAAAHAQHLGALMAQPFRADGHDYALGVELGMALFPTDAVAPRSLLTLAEATAFGAL